MARNFVVSFSQRVHTQTATILYSEIKNFLIFFIIYGLICPNIYYNIMVWGFFRWFEHFGLGFFGGVFFLFFLGLLLLLLFWGFCLFVCFCWVVLGVFGFFF